MTKARVFVGKTRLPVPKPRVSAPRTRVSVPGARFSVPQARFSVPKARFFYALRPDPAAAGELAALATEAAARWGGRPFAAADIHLTLAFVGMRPLGEQPALEAILRGLPAHFRTSDEAIAGADVDVAGEVLLLSRLGSFGHGVLWIGPPLGDPRATPAGAFAHRLANEIRERLRAAGIDFDDRPLKLHATLVRGAKAFGSREDGGRANDSHANDSLGNGDRGNGDRGNDSRGNGGHTKNGGDIRDGGDVRAPEPAPRTIVARSWSLALGASGSDSTPLRRYRWSHPSPVSTESM